MWPRECRWDSTSEPVKSVTKGASNAPKKSDGLFNFPETLRGLRT